MLNLSQEFSVKMKSEVNNKSSLAPSLINMSNAPLYKTISFEMNRNSLGVITKTYEFTTVSINKCSKKGRFGIRPRIFKKCKWTFYEI